MNTSKIFSLKYSFIPLEVFLKTCGLSFFRLVIETLEKQERDKRCFRLVGGVLVERKVGEVEPALVNNREKVSKLFFEKIILNLPVGHRLNFAFLNVLEVFLFFVSVRDY